MIALSCMSARKYRLKRPIGAVSNFNRPYARALFFTIPYDAVVELVREPQDARTVEVIWDGVMYQLFKIDLEEGTTQIFP